MYSSETPVATRATRRDIPEDDILHSHRRENLKSHMSLKYLHIIVNNNNNVKFISFIILIGNLMGRGHLTNQDIDGRMILTFALKW
jgi:hypothetical protein